MMNVSVFSIILPGIILIVCQYTSSVQVLPKESVGYGRDCDQTFICDRKKGLSCTRNVCQCTHPETMVYEPDTSTCAVIAEAPCLFNDPVNLTLKKNVTKLEGSAQRELSCVKNSICDKILKICVCEEHFTSDNGSCIPKKLHNETCSASSDCREDLGLLCNENVCICDPDKAFYDKEDHPTGCVGKVEKPCILNLCTDNARCMNPLNEELESVPTVIKNGADEAQQSTSSMKICSCFDGYDPTPLGTCAKDYGISCDDVRVCKPWLRCGQGGSCECPEPMTQEYDENANACVSKVRGTCNTNFTLVFEVENNICIVGAECVSKNKSTDNDSRKDSSFSSTYHCLCKEGYEENNEGGCDLAFGSKCESDNGTGDNLSCHRKGNLECIEGKCGCKAPMYQYDEEGRACLGRAGALCTIKTLLTTPKINNGSGTMQEQSKSSSVAEKGGIGCIKGARCEGPEKASEVNYAEQLDLQIGICKCTGEDEESCDETGPTKAKYIIGTAAIILGMALVGSLCYALFKRQRYLIDGLNLNH